MSRFAGPTVILLLLSAIIPLPSATSAGILEVEWTRQFGTPEKEFASALAVDSTGVYIAGEIDGTLPGQTSSGGGDVFVRKYDHRGNIVWTRQFGSSNLDKLYDLAADPSGIYIAGQTLNPLPGETNGGAFLRKYDSNGNLIWTRPFGSSGTASNTGVAIGSSGVYITGNDGGPFIRRYDFDGNLVWARSFGSATLDSPTGIAVDSTGVYVIGGTQLTGGADVFVRSFDLAGNAGWTRAFGTVDSDRMSGIAVTQTGIYVAGDTGAALPEQSNAGGRDSFIRKYDKAGNITWTRQFGTSGDDVVGRIVVDSAGVYSAGATNGVFPNQTSAGGADVLLLSFDHFGGPALTRQLGTTRTDIASAIASNSQGVYMAGSTDGAFSGYTGAGDLDVFLVKLSAQNPSAFWENYWFWVAIGLGSAIVLALGLVRIKRRGREKQGRSSPKQEV